MAEIIPISKRPSLTVKADVTKALVQLIAVRVPVLKSLPLTLAWHFKVESTDLLEEWESFGPVITEFLEKNTEGDSVTLLEPDFNKLAYFIYYMGSFYRLNGDQGEKAEDNIFANLCYYFLSEFVGYTAGQEDFDLAEFFYKAFPKK